MPTAVSWFSQPNILRLAALGCRASQWPANSTRNLIGLAVFPASQKKLKKKR